MWGRSEPGPWPPGVLPRGIDWLDRALNRPRLYVPFFESGESTISAVFAVMFEDEVRPNVNGLRLSKLRTGSIRTTGGSQQVRFMRGGTILEEVFLAQSNGIAVETDLWIVYEGGEPLRIEWASGPLAGPEQAPWILEGWYF